VAALERTSDDRDTTRKSVVINAEPVGERRLSDRRNTRRAASRPPRSPARHPSTRS